MFIFLFYYWYFTWFEVANYYFEWPYCCIQFYHLFLTNKSCSKLREISAVNFFFFKGLLIVLFLTRQCRNH